MVLTEFKMKSGMVSKSTGKVEKARKHEEEPGKAAEKLKHFFLFRLVILFGF